MSFSNYAIKKGDRVIFKFKMHIEECKCCKEELQDGEVVYILKASEGYIISFLRGFSAMDETVSLDKIVGVGDETKTAPIVQIENFRGHIILSDEQQVLHDKEVLKNKVSDL